MATTSGSANPFLSAPCKMQDDIEETVEAIDLVGGAWAVIESDPGVFTTLLHRLGVKKAEAQEIYSIDPEGLSHLGDIHAFLFCTTYSGLHLTAGKPIEDTESAVWFANQLVDNACATQALLNILLNCPEVHLGDRLVKFRDFTEGMSPQMKGLAISNDPVLREMHSSLARPADLRAAVSTAAANTAVTEKEKQRAAVQAKRLQSSSSRNRTTKSKGKKKAEEGEQAEDEFHFVGYVPLGGKVWELDGLRSAPIEVGNIPSGGREAWLHVVRPAIELKMQQIQQQGDIRFNLMAIVDGTWEKRSDEFEMLRREKDTLERRLEEEFGADWKPNDPELWEQAVSLFDQQHRHEPCNPAFGYEKQQMQISVLNIPCEELKSNWIRVIREAQTVKALLDSETQKAQRWRRDNLKRAFDYEPFIREFVTALSDEGLLNSILGFDATDEAGEERDQPEPSSARGKRLKTAR